MGGTLIGSKFIWEDLQEGLCQITTDRGTLMTRPFGLDGEMGLIGGSNVFSTTKQFSSSHQTLTECHIT